MTPVRYRQLLLDVVSRVSSTDSTTPETLRTEARRQVDATRQTGRPRGRPKKAPETTTTASARVQADLQVWQTRDRTQRRINNVARDDITIGPQEQRIVTLYEQGRSHQEIADETRKALGTVKSTLSHVRDKRQTGKRQRRKHPS